MPKDIRHYPTHLLSMTARTVALGIRACIDNGEPEKILERYLPILTAIADDIDEIQSWYDDQLKED
jgi:hypothetical protein